MRVLCVASPTIDILDACLSVALDFWDRILGEGDAVIYFTAEKYVETVTRERLVAWHIPVRSDSQETFLFCKAWSGLFANSLPGLECGSQSLESFHSTWERERNTFGGREDTMRIIHTMQTLYESADTFSSLWTDAQRSSLHGSTTANPDLLSGDVLRKAQLSPAIDYHASEVRNPRVCLVNLEFQLFSQKFVFL